MKKTLLISAAAIVAPVLAFAQSAPDTTYTDSVTDLIATVVGALIPIILALALLFFLWGLARYILSAGDEAGRDAAKSQMIWGVIIMFVMVSLWGLVQILQEVLGVDADAGPSDITIPTVDPATLP